MTDSSGNGPLVTPEQLAAAFARLGVQPGDTMMLHSSLKSLGRMDGGTDGVIDAVMRALGPAGHVVVPTHTLCYSANSDVREPYDRQTTPSMTGTITEALRLRPGAARSEHPTHSVAALGPRADWLVSGHRPDGTTFSIDGPHGRYVRLNATIVFLGTTLASNTTYHAVEDWLALPYMPDAEARYRRPDDQGLVRTCRVNNPCGHRNFYHNKGLAVIDTVTAALDAAGRIRQAALNATRLLAVAARDVIRMTTQCELDSPGALLCRLPTCDFCRLGRHHCLLQREAIARRGVELLARPEYCDPTHPAVD